MLRGCGRHVAIGSAAAATAVLDVLPPPRVTAAAAWREACQGLVSPRAVLLIIRRPPARLHAQTGFMFLWVGWWPFWASSGVQISSNVWQQSGSISDTHGASCYVAAT